MSPAEVPRLCQATNPTQVIPFSIDPKFTQMDADDIRAATRMWANDTRGRVAWIEVPIPYAELRFVWLENREDVPVEVGKADKGRFVGLQDGPTIYIVGGIISETLLMLPVAVHEIGHFLGLKHTRQSMDEESCMTPAVDPMCLLADQSIPARDIAQYCDINGCACN